MKSRRIIALAAVLTVTLATAAGCAQMNREQHTGCTVEDKDRAIDAEGSPSYRIYTDCGVFTVADNLFEGQFNSADTYSRLRADETYDLETIGWRNGALSLFPNIVRAEAVQR